MAEECACPTCGGLIARPGGNVILFPRSPESAPPRVDALELPDGRFRLNINLVVSRTVAIRVLAGLQDGD